MGDGTATCLNCGERAERSFCPACGQPTANRRGSVFSLVGDVLTEFLSLDGRHLRSAALLWIPGALTTAYLEGRRASFVPPVRIYFVASLLFFLFVGIPTPDAKNWNVYVDETLIGRDAPVPGLKNLELLSLDEDSWAAQWIEPLLMSKVERLQSMDAQVLLDRFGGGLRRTVPTALIFFVPILAIGLKLIYIRRPFFYVDHLVFAFHFQSFVFVLLVLAHSLNVIGLARIVAGPLVYLFTLMLVVPVYLLLALRRVYGQGWLMTAVKTLILGLLYLVLIQPVMLGTFVLVIRSM